MTAALNCYNSSKLKLWGFIRRGSQAPRHKEPCTPRDRAWVRVHPGDRASTRVHPGAEPGSVDHDAHTLELQLNGGDLQTTYIYHPVSYLPSNGMPWPTETLVWEPLAPKGRKKRKKEGERGRVKKKFVTRSHYIESMVF